jgi:hypothetical protein
MEAGWVVIPVSDKISNLRDWLLLPPGMRRGSAGAAVVLDEIAASHADLLAALERLAKIDLLWAWDGSLTIEENCERARKQVASVANAAIAKARGV